MDTTNWTPRKIELYHKILEYLSDPEVEDLSRGDVAIKACGYSDKSPLYKMFRPTELDEIYNEALTLRRQKYAASIILVDKGLFKRAAAGDPQAAKLIYQRFEGWSPKSIEEHTGKDGEDLLKNFTPLERAARVASLLAIAQRRKASDDGADSQKVDLDETEVAHLTS